MRVGDSLCRLQGKGRLKNDYIKLGRALCPGCRYRTRYLTLKVPGIQLPSAVRRGSASHPGDYVLTRFA